MILKNMISFGQELLSKVIETGDIAIDATVGNGHDTAFLAKQVGDSGHVYGFDIQTQAIMNTREKLEVEHLLKRVTLIQDSHHKLQDYLADIKIKGAMFNLGYLPGGDKSIVTVPETTIQAVQWLTEALESGGLIVVIVYPGHPEGKVESDAFLHYVSTLDQHQFSVLNYEFVNRQNNPPYLIAIEKR